MTDPALKRMKVVYVAGPYRAATEWQVLQNIRRAEELALRIWQSGAACICPHKNTALFGGAADDEVWLRGDLAIILRCDAVVCVDNWRASRGAMGEVAVARAHGIPVFESFGEFETWLNSHRQGSDSVAS